VRITNPLHFTCCLLVLFCGNAAGRAPTTYEVRGVVYDSNSRPLQSIVMSLENQARAQVGQTMTDSDGRYLFTNVASGIYYLTAKPNAIQFQPAVQRIELIDTGPGESVEKVDFVIKLSVRRSSDSSPAGTIFAQPVPPAAEKAYLEAMNSLTKGEKDSAIGHLKRAIEIFPEYFLALEQLGLVYVENEKFQQAVGPLQQARQINPRASHSHLALGVAYVNLDRSKEAVEVLDLARTFDPQSFRVHLYLGIALLNLEHLNEAEKALKQAYALGTASKASMARLYLASIYSKRKQYRRAIDELEGYLHDNPTAGNAVNIRTAIEKLKAKL